CGLVLVPAVMADPAAGAPEGATADTSTSADTLEGAPADTPESAPTAVPPLSWEDWQRTLYAEMLTEVTAGTLLPDVVNPAPNTPFTEFRGIVGSDPEHDGLSFIMDVLFLNNGRYGASHGDNFYRGFHFQLNEGGLGYRTGGLTARAGRFTHSDALDSPYALFINGLSRAAFLYEISWDAGFFSAETRAIELNRKSKLGYPDRGATYQKFALHFGNWDIGYQDAIVSVGTHETWVGDQPLDEWQAEQEQAGHSEDDPPQDEIWRRPPRGDGTGPYFVPEYFFSPIPSFLLQYVLGSGERPWVMRKNHSSIMGLYTRYTGEGWELQAQWLVDDINFNRFIAPDSYQNPDKMGWMLGGRVQTPYGRFGLWHGGATRYTFQPYGSGSSSAGALNRMYGYTYYPAVEYPRGGGLQAIPNRENNIGLYLGENSAGFRLDWDHSLQLKSLVPSALDLRAGLEFTLTGSQSPANPWGEYTSWQQHHREGTRYLDDPVLEKGFIGRLGATWSPSAGAAGGFGMPAGAQRPGGRGWGGVSLEADMRFGGYMNVLKLDNPRTELDNP
ncbi:MAG: hypothetical protein ACOC0D_06400, partial [Spirochaeta sp.]